MDPHAKVKTILATNQPEHPRIIAIPSFRWTPKHFSHPFIQQPSIHLFPPTAKKFGAQPRNLTHGKNNKVLVHTHGLDVFTRKSNISDKFLEQESSWMKNVEWGESSHLGATFRTSNKGFNCWHNVSTNRHPQGAASNELIVVVWRRKLSEKIDPRVQEDLETFSPCHSPTSQKKYYKENIYVKKGEQVVQQKNLSRSVWKEKESSQERVEGRRNTWITDFYLCPGARMKKIGEAGWGFMNSL